MLEGIPPGTVSGRSSHSLTSSWEKSPHSLRDGVGLSARDAALAGSVSGFLSSLDLPNKLEKPSESLELGVGEEFLEEESTVGWAAGAEVG